MGPPKPTSHAAPPWELDGEGVILIYKFSRDWVNRSPLLSQQQKANFNGGLGYVMLVNYLHSPVGPYKELLWIPGKFLPHRRQAITTIFVNTQASTENGRFNWGIPKETQPIDWVSEQNKDMIVVGDPTEPILRCELNNGGPAFPMTTRLLPIRLHQELDGATFRTNPSGSGWAKLARLANVQLNPERFPDISIAKPLICLKVKPFRLQFPRPH